MDFSLPALKRRINQVPELDKLIHERARLLILTHLASMEENDISFNTLREALGFSSGNLSVQLKKLSSADYIKIHKTFKDNKPHTTVSITLQGTRALNSYLNEMEGLIRTLRK
jgi:DNA-binding MarR family transcriptional regulator